MRITNPNHPAITAACDAAHGVPNGGKHKLAARRAMLEGINAAAAWFDQFVELKGRGENGYTERDPSPPGSEASTHRRAAQGE